MILVVKQRKIYLEKAIWGGLRGLLVIWGVFTVSAAAWAQGCLPAPANLVSWWAGDGAVDDEAGGNIGTLQNGATFSPGKVDQGFSFDGQGAHVRIPDTPNLHFTNGLTVEAWIYPTSLGSYHEIVSKWDLIASGQKSYTTALHPDGR